MPIEIALFAPQRAFMSALQDPLVEQIGYGGARGGGKSHVLRVGLLTRALQYPGSRHLLLRRTHIDVVRQHAPELRALLNAWGVKYQYTDTHATFRLPGRSELILGFADRVRHAEKYQGLEYLTVAYDEATQFEEAVFDRIGGSARVAVAGGAVIKKLVTCNPGGVGHTWIKKRFVEAESRDKATLWIPARLTDNLALRERDPGYADRLTRGLPDWMRRQWLEGDWDAREGAYFSLPPASICSMVTPPWARHFAGVDWGYQPGAFAVVWLAVWQDIRGGHHCHVLRDMKRQRLNVDVQAREALEIEEGLPAPPRVRWADPATGKRLEGLGDEAGRTVALMWAQCGFQTQPARRHGRVPGWTLLRQLLAPRYPPERPTVGALTIDPSCQALRAEILDAMFMTEDGSVKSDDMARKCEDHLLDALRYAVVMTFGLNFSAANTAAYTPAERPVR